MSLVRHRLLRESGLRRITLPWMALSITLAFSAGHKANAQSLGDGYVVTPSECILVLPPVRMADDTRSIIWSPDSKRALSFNVRSLNPDFTKPITTEVELSVGRYVRSGHYADTVWRKRFGREPYLAGDPTWIPQTQIVTQIVFWYEDRKTVEGTAGSPGSQEPKQTLLWIDSARSVVREIPMEQGDQLAVSPTKSYAVMIHMAGFGSRPAELTPIRPDGVPAQPVTFGQRTLFGAPQWSADGKTLGITVFSPVPGQKGLTPQTQLFDPETGVLRPGTLPKVETRHALSVSQLSLKTSGQHIKDGSSDALIDPIWLSASGPSERPETLLCANGELGKLSPDGLCVAYRSHGSSWVSEFRSIPLEQYRSMIASAKKAVLISNGKQVALAALMWSQDHNEMLPGAAGITDELMPYLKNSQLFEGLNWTYAGGPIGDIQSPAETELGTIDGPDGQAVMYSDGHVKWRNR